nr:MAG TPA: hypothetical protein [Microviridae sp.]
MKRRPISRGKSKRNFRNHSIPRPANVLHIGG